MNNDGSYTGWRKSSYSNSSANCVEVTTPPRAGSGAAAGGARRIGVRDSKQHGRGPVLEFGAAAWARFLAELKAGHPGR